MKESDIWKYHYESLNIDKIYWDIISEYIDRYSNNEKEIDKIAYFLLTIKELDLSKVIFDFNKKLFKPYEIYNYEIISDIEKPKFSYFLIMNQVNLIKEIIEKYKKIVINELYELEIKENNNIIIYSYYMPYIMYRKLKINKIKNERKL